MERMISIIAAIAENRALGKDNKLLWHIPEDLKRFKRLTAGHPVIMGRKTFESLGRPLPNRVNIVITSNPQYRADGCMIADSLDEAVKKAKETAEGEIFIIGGGQIYKQAISISDKLYLTIVKGDYDADVFFPDYSDFKKVTFKQESSSNEHIYTFIDLER